MGGGQTDEDETTTDWSSKVKLRNITSDEYNLLCDATNDEDALMHWYKMKTISDTPYSGMAEYRELRGYNFARDTGLCEVTDHYSDKGWRAAFESVTPDTDCTDLSVGDVVVMGTLYVGDEAVKVPTNPVHDGDVTAYDAKVSGVTSKITLRTALEDTAYQVKAVYIGNGVFVCDRCMLNWISWDQINAALTPAAE